MTLIASAGVIIASAALFIVLSVFAGLKNYSLQFSSFVDPDLKILPAEGKSFEFTDVDKNKLNNIKGIASFSEVIEERIIIKSENKNLLNPQLRLLTLFDCQICLQVLLASLPMAIFLFQLFGNCKNQTHSSKTNHTTYLHQ